MVTLQMVHSVGEWPVARMILLASVMHLALTAGFAGTMTPCESCLLLPGFSPANLVNLQVWDVKQDCNSIAAILTTGRH